MSLTRVSLRAEAQEFRIPMRGYEWGAILAIDTSRIVPNPHEGL